MLVLEIAAVDNADDYVIGLAVYPQPLASTEADTVEQLFDAIEHPAN